MSARKREREAPEVGAMARRVLRALVRRAADGDTEALEQLLILAGELPAAIHDAGVGLHRFGYSYTEIGTVAGITRQAARERFADTPTNAPDLAVDAPLCDGAPMGVAQ
jgi:hypothetical protein